MTTNPVWNAAGISSIVSALIALLVAFGVPLTEQQTTAILGFVAVVAPIAVAWVSSSKVTPLSAPRDTDGTPLTRPDNSPANKEYAQIQDEALQMDVTRTLNNG